jgi:glutamyl-tRNA synthetase
MGRPGGDASGGRPLSEVRGRFAPSPTGSLHLGNARTALLAWASARSAGGAFVLRVEDLDGPRTVPAAVDGNLAELRWLGLDWDEGPDVGGPHAPYRQSERDAHYQAALERLRRGGALAEDWLSRRDVHQAASAPHGPAGPVYGPAERRLSAALASERRSAGRAPAWRARFPPGVVEVDDRRHGPCRFDLERDVGDVVVRRSDGLWAYALAVVVDDAAMGITEVVRGDDLLAATGAQAALARALGLPRPGYAHVPLLLDAAGERMAKRRGSTTLGALREGGVDPRRVIGALAFTLGWLDAPRPLHPRDPLGHVDLWGGPAAPARWSDDLDAWLRAP